MSTDFPAWYQAELNSEADVSPSSQTIAKPRVTCCFKSKGRCGDVRKRYTRHGGAWNDENKLFFVGEQMEYEWQQDFNTMKWALQRIDEFLEVAKKNNYFTGTLHIAKEELLNRISKDSCPSNLKDEYKNKENCPLNDACKCSQGVSEK